MLTAHKRVMCLPATLGEVQLCLFILLCVYKNISGSIALDKKDGYQGAASSLSIHDGPISFIPI